MCIRDRALLDEAAAEFEGQESVAVYGRDDDRELLEELVADYDGFEYGGDHDCLGGVVAEKHLPLRGSVATGAVDARHVSVGHH